MTDLLKIIGRIKCWHYTFLQTKHTFILCVSYASNQHFYNRYLGEVVQITCTRVGVNAPGGGGGGVTAWRDKCQAADYSSSCVCGDKAVFFKPKQHLKNE